MSRHNNVKVKEHENWHYCSLCKLHFHCKLESHANEQHHKNNLCFMDWKSQKHFVQPFIIAASDKHGGKIYECLACNCVIRYDPKYLGSHINGERHCYTIEQRCFNILPVQDDQFYCAPCDFVIINFRDIPPHINDEAHISSQVKNMKYRLSRRTTWESFVCPFVKEKSDQEFYCMICDVSISNEDTLSDHVKGKVHANAVHHYEPCLTPLENDFFYCQLCDLVFPSAVNVRAHLLGRSHLNNSTNRLVGWLGRHDFVAPFVHQVSENDFYCIACDRPISSAVSLESHKKGKTHMDVLECEIEHIAPLENGSFTCDLCECSVNDHKKVGPHLTGYKHSKKLGMAIASRRNRAKVTSWKSIKNCVKPFILNENNNKFYCILCNYSIIGSKTLESHSHSAVHRVSLAQQSPFIHLLDNGSFYCSLCDDLILDHYRVDSHVKTSKHCSLCCIVAAQENKNCQAIKFESDFAESASTETHNLPKAEKNRDVKCNNFAAPKFNPNINSAAKSLRDFDESLLNFQKVNSTKSPDIERNSESDEAVSSTYLKPITPITKEKQPVQRMTIESIVWLRNLVESFESSQVKKATRLQNSIPDEIETPRQNTQPLKASSQSAAQRTESPRTLSRLLSENDMTPEIDLNGDRSPENDTSLSEQELNKKYLSLSELKATSAMEKNQSSESVDSGNQNLSPMDERLGGAKKSYFERVVSLLDFEEDIYDMSERMTRVKLGFDLRFVIDSTRSYCLVCRKTVSFKDEMNNYLVHLCSLKHLQHLDEMGKGYQEISGMPRSCNELSMAFEYIEFMPNDVARCLVCQVKIEDNDCLLLQHIDDEKHRKAREDMRVKSQREKNIITSQIHCDWYKVQKYECVTCSKKFDVEIDFVEHLIDDEDHAKQLKIIVNDGAKLIYQFCSVCALIYCGSSNVQTNHHNNFSHKWFVRNGSFVADELPQSATKLLISLINNETYQTIDVMREIEEECKSSIVKAYSKGTGHHFKLNKGTEAPVEDIQFIKFFNRICPSSANMVCVLKQWLVKCDLFGARQISTTALYWYVILYLQAISILPSITTLTSMKIFCRGLIDWKESSRTEEQQNFILREHLVGFFSLYANFDYRYDIACPLLGKVIEKRAFADNINRLPEEMKSYVYYMSYTEFAEPFRSDSVMCLQDPFDLQNNLTKSVSKFDLSRFRIFCSKSYSFFGEFET